MKSKVVRVVLATIAVAIFFASYLHRGPAVFAQSRGAVAITRLYPGADGQSHVEHVDLKFVAVPGATGVEESEHVKAAAAYVVRLAPGFYDGWHNADKRRYVLPMSGRAEIEIAGGEKITLEPGHLVLAEDLTGKGHTFRVLGSEDWVALFVDFQP